MGEAKLKVLVVDDEKIVRDFFKRLLSLLGLEVIDVEDGYKAVEAVKAGKFDLYFIDVRMPGLNGLETYRQIRQIDPDAQAVMITGYAVEDTLEQARKEGAYGDIRKPFDISQIKEVLDKVSAVKSGEQLNILVIDDDETILEFFSSLLAQKNLSCKSAHSKEEAVMLAKQNKFNLIFLDLVLKDANGVDAYNELKAILPEANIVLITGFPQKAKSIEGTLAVSGCLYKPFEINNILKYIETAKSKK
ncbi:MAG: response regulator [Candidatus Omnitrophota bacterium]